MTQSSQPQAGVLFDIDGTLVDSNYQHAYAWWRVLQEAGYGVPMFEIHRRIGMGSDYLLEELIGEFSQELSEARARHFRPFQSELKPFEGAAELLRAVHGQGSKVVLATSADKEDLKVLLEVIDAEDAIDQVTSAADVEHSKPSPDVFERPWKYRACPLSLRSWWGIPPGISRPLRGSD